MQVDSMSLDVLKSILEDWRDLWEEAGRYGSNLSPAGRAAALTRTDDPHDALRELLPALGSLHPNVIAFVLATLGGSVRTVGRLLDEAVTPAGQNVPMNDPADDAGDPGGSRAERVRYARWLEAENRRLMELGVVDCEERLAAIEAAPEGDLDADEDLDFIVSRGEAARIFLSRSENYRRRRRLTAPS